MRINRSGVVAAAAGALLLTGLPLAATADATVRSVPIPAVTSVDQTALVGFEAGSLPHVGQSFAGVTVVDVIERLDVAVVSAPTAAIGALSAVPGVVYVEADEVLSSLVVPGDAQYGGQYGPDMMGFPAAWDAVGYGSEDVVVAVLDTGTRTSHQDLGRHVAGYDYVNNDDTPNDDCGHGTHVAGTIGATTDNGIGVAGMSQASLQTMKVLGPIGGLFTVTCSGSTSDIAEAIVDATDQGARIISMSLGGGGTSTLENAVNYAWNNGVLVVAAAGNDGGNDNVGAPAVYDNSIAVGALDASGNRASYSDGGPELDIMAPGSNVLSTYNGSNSDYDTLSGTSMATPHVSGALALALSCAPTATNVEVRDALYSTAEDLETVGFDNATGHGLARVDLLVDALCDGSTDPGPDPDPDPGPDPDPDPDPDPSTPTIVSGQSISIQLNAANADRYFKVAVPADASNLQIAIDGPSCGLLGCGLDADLSTNPDTGPTDSSYACRPYESGSDETCNHGAPSTTTGYWFIRVNRYSGSGTVTLTATVS